MARSGIRAAWGAFILSVPVACGTALLLSSCATAEEAAAQEASTHTPSSSRKALLLKDWALSRCLARVYKDGAAKEDAKATASAYLERGRQPIEAYEAIDRLIEQYANRTGAVKSSFNTMKCIDLFHSAELERLASKYSASKPR